ncbi:MAG: phosphoribosylaminoimidazolesuccinocarboxamide synthase [Candidatus Izemoplasmatales bacterium]|jgi:phosphoribosylaminoimidazole-succinocarboxamide synthase|nr:phosphoribosylaminoimidazolesuccinocarboxamide synthase [Candidatus Izemoplasmatales bacterium]MDD3865095.1 phosphoribosylaminoimidazolesuccinocarboxamide synthase [Candidatus Izemoplasmatales bacterium]
MINKCEMVYEGKAKKVYTTSDPNYCIIHYKDDATAFNGIKKSSIPNKGIINNEFTSIIFTELAKKGILTHFIKKLDDREQLCWKVSIIKVEVIVRNIIAGSMAKRLGIPEGTIPPNHIFEMSYKNDEYQDPLINEDHAVALGLATYEELAKIKQMTADINQILFAFFDQIGILLVDFKIEFGKDSQGNIMLADEISPDTCRFWDKTTLKKLDKDRFRRDLGSVEEAYYEILSRIKTIKEN